MSFARIIGLIGFILLAMSYANGQARASEALSIDAQARSFFPDADHFGPLEGAPPAAPVSRLGRVVGYLFLTEDVLRIPAYSGRPINTLVGIDVTGRIVGLAIIDHQEPILAVGITEARLARFTAQYAGKSAFDRVVIGAQRDGHLAIDGISGATITVMVQNATVMRSVALVAASRGITAASETRSAGDPGETAAHLAQAPLATSGSPQPTQLLTAADGPPHAIEPTEWLADRRIEALPGLGSLASAMLGRWSDAPDEAPMWVAIWHERVFEIGVLLIGLATLTFILVFQDWLARHPKTLTRVRNGFMIYTLVFIGWWGLAQLSVINVLTFVNVVMHDFSWEIFLLDPLLFILWSFVAVTLLLWGRGVYCGWLCPFGALQELTLQISRWLKLPAWEFSDAVHERLLALKYVILVLLFGISLQSLSDAAWYAEVEPFKTVTSMRFDRAWPFVTFALALIVISLFNRKFFCKYLCPLGAALAIPGRFRLFDWWLRRRRECGTPCQACANRCSVRAIRPTGEINANECHYCLDCQVVYYNDRICAPLIDRRKRREQRKRPENPVATAA
jgi:NosR/NirI family transcriptional regulator, nitrous oxide reductase regulator